ncbi:phosphomannomutase [Shewanella youngdeokensis]|uniref:Phosphomannomutase n=1 Tax=Shewanella youngdeokensis TaxID=2999068 RepID=A0ABZ0K1D0_9GAMM|nr:phosphomannomutase [Shewanella sp. DAU334]
MAAQILNTKQILANSGVQFGTSGARGLVVDFTSDVCAAFTAAFINVMKVGYQFNKIAIAIDNRPSSYAMAQACSAAAEQLDIEVIYYGVLPTPGLAYAAMQQSIPCIMVTGSHIPFDRNGLKFYRPDGEISKQDELAILNVNASFFQIDTIKELDLDNSATELYVKRYTSLYSNKPLLGKRIGIYEHSSAGRDLYAQVFEQLGAEVISLERTNTFVPIDTEAVSEQDCQKAINWSKEFNLDAIFSTDGDGDRPLLADENGTWLRGDILGLLCASQLEIQALAVPVSCNTAIELSQYFSTVTRTRIGSPYVIAAFEPLSKQYLSVAGFEANGGFILGSDVSLNNTLINSLPTRDALLPAIVVLVAAQKSSLVDLVSSLPRRVTASDRIKDFATSRSIAIIEQGQQNPQTLLERLGFQQETIAKLDSTDGLRMTLSNQDIIHLRPSGNAPELRCYAESRTEETAKNYVLQVLDKVTSI